ncbi:MAG TPA: hypothetical protein VKZ68_10000 [Ohtaekwangia sp.]|nr:hypothetical protein [Ohtaekwangia sp.]
MDAVIEFGKILIPAALVLYAAYLLVRSQIQKELELKRIDVREQSITTVLPIRLQAYERMTLFLERISPQNLLVRLNTGGMPAREFHQLLLQEIRNEFNHNVSQQVYMSHEVWEMIKNAKEDIIVTINEAAGEVAPDAQSIDLSKRIIEKFVNRPVDLTSHALIELKKEIQRSF